MKKMPAFFTVLFGLLFMAIGIAVATLSVRTVFKAHAMQTWREVPATLVSCDLHVSHDAESGATYQTRATYTYTVDGKPHTGTRVSLHGGSDNVGAFHQRVYADLKQHMNQHQPTSCWVNPQNPDDAILVRKPRPELLFFMQFFSLGFGAAGLCVVLFGLSALFQHAAAGGTQQGPAQIRMRGAQSHRNAGIVAAVWNIYTIDFTWLVAPLIAPDPLPWYAWVFVASGLIPAGLALYLIGRFRKFGVSTLDLSPAPGTLGDTLSGTIRIPVAVQAQDGFDLSLTCTHQHIEKGAKNSTVRRDVLWTATAHLDQALSLGTETGLPVRFALPSDQPATSAPGGSNGYYWQLTAKAATPGIDYRAVFDVPVRQPANRLTATPEELQA